jgi:hypothetical protein
MFNQSNSTLKKRLVITMILTSLAVIAALTVREALATSAVASNMDSATRSYRAWAQAIESKAKDADSATRSYTAWAKFVEMENALISVTGNTLCQNYAAPANVNSATRSYIAWAYSVECR